MYIIKIRISIPKIISIIGLLLFSSLAFGQKTFPGAEGYGTNSRAAYADSTTPEILIVDNLNPDMGGNEITGRGSLYWALSRTYPRIIVFEVGGVIDYDESSITSLIIDDPYLTVYGQTAPVPGIIVKGAYVRMITHDVLIQHMKFRIGDDLRGTDPNTRDCMTLSTDAENIVIDHCSFEWSIDEAMGVTSYTSAQGNFTFSNNIFAEPLYKSLHYSGTRPERHAYNLLTYHGDMTFKNNLFAFSYGRNPFLRPGKKVVINNFTFSTGWVGTTLCSYNSLDLLAVVVGNISLSMNIEEFDISANDYAVFVTDQLTLDSRLYLTDNTCELNLADTSLTQWECVLNNSRVTQAVSPPFDISEYTILPSSEVEDYVLANAGAFYWDRDYVDERVVTNVRNRFGQLINSPDSLPAIATVLDQEYGAPITGNMAAGYDWSVDTQSIIVNSTTINLNQNCANITEVISHINSQMPGDVECFRLNGYVDLDWVGIRTTSIGSSQSMILSGDGLATLGIPEGTYYGSDGNGYDFESTSHSLTLPANPHEDDDSNGYTNIEEWAYDLADTTVSAVTDNPDAESLPERVFLHQNYPNPFSTSTKIKFEIPNSTHVSLNIYDITGRKVKELINDFKNAGSYEVSFDGSALTSGVYFSRIETGSFVQIKHMLLVK